MCLKEMVKRLILCADNRSPYSEKDTYYKYCVGLSQVYAKKYNVDFIFDELKSVPDGRHWAWARILLFAKYYPQYDEIIWLDSDTTIINHEIDVFSLFKTAPSSLWERDASVEPILYACRDSPNRNDVHAKKVCTGILLLSCVNKAKVKDVLNDWWNDISDDKFKQGFPYEQSVINDVWRLHPEKRNYVKGVDLDSFFNDTDKQAFIHLTGNYYITEIQLHEAKKYVVKVQHNRKKKIGLFVRQQNFYSSGCGQNCIFMRQSLELLGYTVDLLVENYDTKKSYSITSDIAILYKDLNKVNINDYELFIFGSVIPSQQFRDLAKVKQIKTVMFHCMNSMDALHIDTFTYPKKSDSVPLFESNFHNIADEVWLTNNHEETVKPYIEILNNYKVPIKPIALTWSPLFVSPSKKQLYYEYRSSPLVEFVIIEPNMSYLKNAWIPLMIAEYVNKNQKNLKMVNLFDAPDDKTAINELQIAKENKLKCFPRMQINEIVKMFANRESTVIFISHQYNLQLNYAYFDILSSGFPFIHNSKKLLEQKLGYYYETLEDASSAVKSIVTSYNSDKERQKTNLYLDTIHPGNKNVLQRFSDLVTSRDEPKTYIIQVGSHVGNTENDMLFKNINEKFNYIMIEPVPYLFDKLKENYKSYKNVTCLNIAISNKNGTIEMTIPSSKNDFSKMRWWASQIASVNPNHIKTLMPECITETILVECKTLNTLIQDYKIADIEGIFTDTEGHDYDILMDLDITKIKPRNIIFENNHMDGVKFQLDKTNAPNYYRLLNHFGKHGYVVSKETLNDTSLLYYKHKIIIVVLTVNKERELWMRKQIQELKIPFQVEFFQGFTPDTSKDYLLSKEENEVLGNGTLCITRSYAALFNEWSTKPYDYLITLEDDVLLSNDFVQKVESTISAWKQHPSLEFISLGVNLSFNALELDASKCTQNLYYENVPSTWGAMAMMFTPTTVNAAAKALHFQTVKEIKESLYTFKSKKLYRNRNLYSQIDAILPTIYKQGILYPPIAIESSNFISSKDGAQNTNQEFAKNHPQIRMDTFYKS